MNIKQQALLYLTYLLVYSDGEFDDDEKSAITYICEQEGISENDYQGFLIECQGHSERELFDKGVDLLEECVLEDKKKIFVWLYKLSESDGTVHAKEVRFLLYSLRRASVNLDEIKAAADQIPSIPPSA
jgi:uncharacterized tellurite resistance protein B-like protein